MQIYLGRKTTLVLSLAALSACFSGSTARAGLIAYYTLDSLSAGIQNQGADGATSDLSVNGTGVALAGGSMIGAGAMSFAGSGHLQALGTGNAADDLAGYPFTMSLWLRNAIVDTGRDAAMSVSNRAPADKYYNLGVNAAAQPELAVRNTTFNGYSASSAVTGPVWHNVIAVFAPGNYQRLYVDGKLATTGNDPDPFDTNVNTLTLGAFVRNNTARTDSYKGDIDDAGLFDTALSEADVALANGLGRTGGIGLDQLDEAQALAAASVGTTTTIGGAQWQRVAGLSGTTGDFGGTVADGDAYIVIDAAGNGIQAVPEPSTFALAAIGLAVLALSRRRRSV